MREQSFELGEELLAHHNCYPHQNLFVGSHSNQDAVAGLHPATPVMSDPLCEMISQGAVCSCSVLKL